MRFFTSESHCKLVNMQSKLHLVFQMRFSSELHLKLVAFIIDKEKTKDAFLLSEVTWPGSQIMRSIKYKTLSRQWSYWSSLANKYIGLSSWIYSRWIYHTVDGDLTCKQECSSFWSININRTGNMKNLRARFFSLYTGRYVSISQQGFTHSCTTLTPWWLTLQFDAAP